MRDLVRDYLADHAAQNSRPRTLADVRRHLERHLAPLHGLPVADVDRRAVAARLLELSRSVSPVLADKVRTTLSATFAWGIRTGLVDGHNPVIGTHRGKPPVRERVLSMEELHANLGRHGGRHLVQQDRAATDPDRLPARGGGRADVGRAGR